MRNHQTHSQQHIHHPPIIFPIFNRESKRVASRDGVIGRFIPSSGSSPTSWTREFFLRSPPLVSSTPSNVPLPHVQAPRARTRSNKTIGVGIGEPLNMHLASFGGRGSLFHPLPSLSCDNAAALPYSSFESNRWIQKREQRGDCVLIERERSILPPLLLFFVKESTIYLLVKTLQDIPLPC